MNEYVFILISLVYVISLALIDALFNRLVFREDRKLSYFSYSKQKIYQLPEWQYIGVVLLIILPIVFPILTIHLFLGVKYMTLYLIVLVLVPWDNIFGKIVFGNWFGDTPSIALPFVGWLHFNLRQSLVIRAILALILIILYI